METEKDTITASSFINLWRQFSSTLPLNPGSFKTNAEITKLIIGEKRTETENSPLGDFI